jgi:ABC-2 type transport system permease protein
MRNKPIANHRPNAASGAAPTWWLVFVRELNELWMGGKAPVLLFIYTILLGILAWVFASNNELSLLPTDEVVFEMLKAIIAVGLFISMVVGADAISGERERATLESLLLTPSSRRQLVFGKFLAAISIWPVALAIAIPYIKVLSQGHEVFGRAVPWGALMGTILAPAFTGLGMLASFWSNTNKTSLFTSLGIYIFLLLTALLPGSAQTGQFGVVLQKANPYASTIFMLAKSLASNRTIGEFWSMMISPVAFATIIYVLLFGYASPGLRLEGGKSGKFWTSFGRLVGASLLLVVCLVASPRGAVALTLPQEQSEEMVTHQNLQITVNMAYKTLKTGDNIEYTTVVTNKGNEPSPNLSVAMNIINLDAAGDVVDPEDWSPQRTQYMDVLQPGESKTLSWRINAILDGDFLVYMVLIPQPKDENSTSQPIASSAIHLTVTKFTKVNPSGILPYAIGGPIVLILGIFILYRIRRRKIDMGEAVADAE